MANTFKNASIKSVSHSGFVDLYTCPAATTAIILGLALTNKTSNAVTASVQMIDSSASGSAADKERLILNEVSGEPLRNAHDILLCRWGAERIKANI